MATLRQLKEKRESINSIYKITSAMKMVSTAKAQVAFRELSTYKVFYQKVDEIIKNIAKGVEQPTEFAGTLWVIFYSDMGLAGAYNSNVLKYSLEHTNKDDKFIIIGTKGEQFKKQAGIPDENVTSLDMKEFKNESEMKKLIRMITSAYYDDKMEVKSIFTEYISAMEFTPTWKQLLPLQIEEEAEEAFIRLEDEIDFEPDKETLLREVMPLYIETMATGVYKEALTSEHSARRIAMENATKNSEDLLEDLTREFNKQRQAKITQEISEIIGGSEALK